MTRDELIDALAERAGVPRHSAQVFLHACFDVTKSLLRNGELVSLPGIGSWSPQRTADGTLVAVSYAASHPATSPAAFALEAFALHETAALADARHFIPAAALQAGSPVERIPVDLAEIVADVRRSFGLIEAGGQTSSVEEATRDDASASAALPSHEAAAEIPAVPVLSPSPDLEADEEEALLEMEMEAEGYQTDPLSDDAVFHRNRDQLYHPPDEPGRRKLLITAGILTFCVLVIIVYLLLDQGEPRELPGSAPVGAHAVACERHMRG